MSSLPQMLQVSNSSAIHSLRMAPRKQALVLWAIARLHRGPQSVCKAGKHIQPGHPVCT